MRNLTIGERRLLAKALRSSSEFLYSLDLAPTDVNILPMQIVIDEETIERCVASLETTCIRFLGPTAQREIVLSVLKAATDNGRGGTKDSEPETGGDPT